MKVKTGKLYKYEAVGLDIFDARTDLINGDIVKVIALPGCPRPNIMGHCHVSKDGKFVGPVLCNSLNEVE